MIKGALLFLVALCLAAAAPASRPGQPRPLPAEANKTFVHEPSKFEFPFNVNAFRRASVVAFDEAGKNIAIGYADPALKIIVTVYIYPNYGLPAADHFKQIKQDVLKVNKTAKLVEEKPITTEPPKDGQKQTGSFARFSMHGMLNGAEQELFSEAVLFSHGKHFVKLRLTYPAADAKAAQPRVENFINALVFPEIAEKPAKP
jgi:hypothetical protein